MTNHTSAVLADSIKKEGMHGISFTTRCCGDPATDIVHLIDNAHWLTPEAIDYKINAVTQKHAEMHAGMDTVEEHLNRLVGAAVAADCGCDPK